MMPRMICLLLMVLLLPQCDRGVEKEREIGYLGKARANPFLALERFVEQRYGEPLNVKTSWPIFDENLAVIFLTADQISSRGVLDPVKQWIQDGGHAIVLLDRYDMHTNDWGRYRSEPELPEVLIEWGREMDWELEVSSTEKSYKEVQLRGDSYKVDLTPRVLMRSRGQEEAPILSSDLGAGTLTWISDASILRNRWIESEEHIELIAALFDYRSQGEMVFLCGVGISFFGLLWQKGWMVVIALLAVVFAWLLRHVPRFGPMLAHLREDQMRAYDHHLEMIGDFHWRLDRGASLLAPLRREAQEICHHWQVSHGRLDDGLFEVMASRAEISIDRVSRAMTDLTPRDQLVFINIVADLQQIRKSFA